MIRFFRFAFLFLLVAIIFACILFYFIDRSVLNSYLVGVLVQAASSSGLNISINDASPFFLGLSLTTLKVFLPQALLSLQIDTATCDCSLSSLLGHRQCHISGTAYSGTFSGDIKIEGNNFEILNGSLKDLHIETHTQMKAFGVESGTLTADIPQTIFSNGKLESIDARIAIANFSKPEETQIPQKVTKLPIPIIFPPFSSEKLVFSVNMAKETYSVKDLSLTSSLGSLDGAIEGHRGTTNGPKTAITGHLSYTPTEGGVASLKPILMFLCPGDLILSGKKLDIHNADLAWPGSWSCEGARS